MTKTKVAIEQELRSVLRGCLIERKDGKSEDAKQAILRIFAEQSLLIRQLEEHAEAVNHVFERERERVKELQARVTDLERAVLELRGED